LTTYTQAKHGVQIEGGRNGGPDTPAVDTATDRGLALIICRLKNVVDLDLAVVVKITAEAQLLSSCG